MVTGCFYLYLLQVLTGDIPLLDVLQSSLVYAVVCDRRRPVKPWNAPALGFSDSLWNLTQRCWDGEIVLRPEVGEVVRLLGEAANNWNGLMPPCPKTESITSSSRGVLDLKKYREFEIQVLHSKGSSSNGIDGLSRSSPDIALEGLIGSQTAGPFSPLIEPPTQAAYQVLWEDVTNATSEAEAVQALAKIVVDKHGRAFALCLELMAAELCVEILDYVSCGLCPSPFAAVDDLFRASQSAISDHPRGALSSSC